MVYINRKIQSAIERFLAANKSVLLLGPRQTGKTTLIQSFPVDWSVSFLLPRVRQRYERNPSALADEVIALFNSLGKVPLVVIDEVQKVPGIMDVAQALIDAKQAQFILTGSSARKLRRAPDANWLPGRVIPLFMTPFSVLEYLSYLSDSSRDKQLTSLLLFGSLPEVLLTQDSEIKNALLSAYVSTYLEEEVRSEALVRDLAPFTHFLELSAEESGLPINQNKLSQKIGVAQTTIAAYYRILEDCLITERISPIIESKTRHRLSKSDKVLFFDLGVRRLAAGEGLDPNQKQLGHLFEQFVGLECLRLLSFRQDHSKLKYWRDLNGPEVDWVMCLPDQYIPIEVKWTDVPKASDAKHLERFIDEYEPAHQGFVVCRSPNLMQLTDRVRAVPWDQLERLLDS